MSLLNYWKTRVLLTTSAVGTIVAGLLLSRAMGFPAPGIWHVSVLLQPSPVVAVAAVALVMAIGVVLGSLLAGRIRPEAGLLAGCFGWAALSWTSGSIAQALFSAPKAETYTRFATETLLLGAVLAVAQAVLGLCRKNGALKADIHRDGIELPEATAMQVAIAMVSTAAIYLLLTFFLLANVEEQQAMIGCAVAAWVAAAAVHYTMAVDLPVWSLWPGIILAAAGSYLYAGSSAPGIPGIAWIPFPSARALPLDHASAGVAAALFGYWDARRWRRPNLIISDDGTEAPAATN